MYICTTHLMYTVALLYLVDSKISRYKTSDDDFYKLKEFSSSNIFGDWRYFFHNLKNVLPQNCMWTEAKKFSFRLVYTYAL